MKASAEKSSVTASKTAARPASQPFFTKAGGGNFFAPASRTAAPSVQMKMTVGKTGDKFEREADKMADKVMRMPTPAPQPAKKERIQRKADERLQKAAKQEEKIQKAPAGEDKLRRKGEGVPAVTPNLQSAIRSKTNGGQPLSADVRRDMESRFNADFSKVRIHSNAEAAGLSNQLSARAFTHQNHIFFSRNQYQPGTSEGKQLLAHELTHTIQQGHAVQRSPQVSTTVTSPQVQRLGLSDILDGLADLAANVPGFTLLTVIIGRNPINMRVVERNFVNLLRGFMGLIPGGEILFQVLNRYGVVERLGNWVNQQVTAMGLNYEYIRSRFTAFTDSLSWTDIFSPGDVWRRAQNIFTEPVTRVANFVSSLISQAVTWLKETFMQPLSEFCRQVPGYGLVTVLLGRDPFTDAPVPRTALNVVRAFAEFIPGGTEKVDQLVQSGALQRAYDWFVQETQARNLTWARVTGTFAQAWNTLQLEDVLHPIDTLRRITGLFSPLLSDLVSFAGAALMKLLELIYEAAMGAGGARILALLKRGRDTFMTIIRNPVRFLGHLLGAVGQGVRQFMTNILRHLQTGVIAWLTGPVAQAGIQIPERWDLQGIIWFVLQILGLTWTRVRQKLVNLMGERAVGALETGFQLIQDIRERGLVQALRDRVTEFFGNLREAALGAIRSFIQQRLVQAGIQQILSLLTPVGAVIQAVIKTFTTIQFFIQRINQILDLVESVVNSIAAIASGSIAAAANFIERTMARTIPVILDFLARFIGLGDVGAQVQRTIQGLQARVDGMLDRAVEWVKRQAANLASRLLGGNPNAPPQERLQNGLREGVQAVNRLSGNRIGIAVIRPVLAAIRLRHNMQRLDAEARNGRWVVVGVINPTLDELTQKDADAANTAVTQSSPQFFPSRNAAGWGTGMIAIKQGASGGGSTPSISNSQFEDLNLRRHDRATSTSTASYYVLGHLLNQQLGGPGNTWGNLTPLSRSGNAQHEEQVESHIKNAVQSGKTIKYEVRVQYNRTASPLLTQVPENATSPVLRNKRKVLLQENHVPSALECTATEWDINTDQVKAGGFSLPAKSIPNIIESSSLADYNVPGQAVLRLQVLAINDSLRILFDSSRAPDHALHQEALLSLPGIGSARFAELTSRRSYRTWQDIWGSVHGVTKETTDAWRAGLSNGARVVLNGTTVWSE